METIGRGQGCDGEQVFSVVSIYCDSDGESQIGRFDITLKGRGDIGFVSELICGLGCQLRMTPSDYDYDWHVAPTKQFVVCLDSGVHIQVSSGSTIEIAKGSLFLVEDTWGKGHRSRSIDNQQRYSIFIPVSDPSIGHPKAISN
mmetsp:Transcript_6461/g.11516  ORF Transcript_6461/g.11516 Transcript_6461/m.11516 type:complete len:144 (-) Transcript_6461:10062-10493(-)